MTDDYSQILHELFRDQHATASWNQMRDAGLPEDWILREIRRGRIIREGPAAYRPRGVKRDWKLRASAALLSARAPALISHRSAAWLYGIDEHMPGIIDVTVPRHRRPRSRPGVQFHESRLFDVAKAIRGAVSTGAPASLVTVRPWPTRNWRSVAGIQRKANPRTTDGWGLPQLAFVYRD